MKEINERRIAYLYEAVTIGTVRAAADKLNVAPSAVSRQITLLEEELATRLIERNRKGVKATEAGLLMLKYYREALAHEEEYISRLRALRGLQHGHIDLAVGEGFLGDLMGNLLPDFNSRYPAITVSVKMSGTNDVIRQIQEDEVHIGLVFHPQNYPDIRSQASCVQPICAIAPPDHPLRLLGRKITLAEACQYPLALQESHFGVRQLLTMAEFKERLRMVPTVTSNSISVLKHFVRSGMGITFLPAFVVRREIADGHLSAIEIDQPLLSSGEIHVVTRLGRQLSEGPHRMLQYLIRWMRSFSV